MMMAKKLKRKKLIHAERFRQVRSKDYSKKGIVHIAISFDECCLELVTS